jgi:CBS domain-containing protein
MSARNAVPDVIVEDVMSAPVITIKDTDTVLTAAKLMKKHKIGCVVVVDKSGKPHGLITERDIVRRVTALDLDASKMQASKCMTKPPVTIDTSASITDAAKKMRELKVRRLVVLANNKLKGIVTSNDVVDITPALIDVIAEKSQISPVEKTKEAEPLSGYCDRCGSWADELKSRNGQFVCEECASDTEETDTEEES